MSCNKNVGPPAQHNCGFVLEFGDKYQEFCIYNLLKYIIELLKNSMIRINKTASNIHFNEAETDRELIFQQL
ncbi:hypothetical protein LBK6_15040 [Leptospira borgpetersenii serovar Hardjo]|nr:hypothetical protein LBK6_15040 [Leptospira borgpetersenii serovar Hardjo]AWV71298.1 hypothetical protein B9T54_16120 [Leptospira borgpetersenii serovar Hardjo-bovis]AMX62815.1 hypothetical protein LBK9_14960 [Leptospira borgpetersenii serovar Hardjo]AMX66058.1 hypothetical protein LBK30_14965 [Leptospira borgpetersenii serovar Hardjo]AMX69290.1 hypothetical protein LBHA_14925 [Leptospira borgpetersenii serovar Hardjo]